jgi:predicted ribosomally synthesized peptide with SipW-like signal peptide
MTITKTAKTKLVLGILAAAVSLSLAIGGTLMLFTAQTDIATNVVTLGSADIALQESGVLNGNEDTYLTVGKKYAAFETPENLEGVFTGFDFGDEIIPGDTIYKKPRVVNTGNIPVYVYVEGTLSVTYTNAAGVVTPVNFTPAHLADPTNAPADVKELMSILNSVIGEDMGDYWWASPVKADNNKLVGTWYYANIDNDAFVSLKALDPDVATDDIFTQVEIPDTVTSLLEGYKISLDFKACAVQSDNNNAANIDQLKAQF